VDRAGGSESAREIGGEAPGVGFRQGGHRHPYGRRALQPVAHWAGVIPLRLEPSAPIADPRLASGIEAPIAVQTYRRPG
jgi:hypothetical protein